MAANRFSAKGRIVMTLYRTGRALPRRARRFFHPFYYAVVDLVLGISLPLQAEIGPGLTLRHGQGVVVSWKSIIGPGCELHQHVTLGERKGGVPSLGSNVTVGANAVILGAVHVGDSAQVGAGAVVLTDVPAGAVAVGNPARVIAARSTIDRH